MFNEAGFFTRIKDFWEEIQFILEHRKKGDAMAYHAERYNSPGKYDADYFLVNDGVANSVKFFYENDAELYSPEGLEHLKSATMPLSFKQFGSFDGYLPDVFATFEDYLFISEEVKSSVEALNIPDLLFYPAQFDCKGDVSLGDYYLCVFKKRADYVDKDNIEYRQPEELEDSEDLDDGEDEPSEVLERFSLDDIALNKLNESQRLLFQLDLNNIILCHKSVAAIFDQQFYPIEPLSLKWL